ncbi:VOC family protein [Acuticoccus kandeliae]|uniref:VOC family protein n=1 Tax=Acuticoccus kandeliae TaxID=2073160 RepID=UPI000D3EAA90|nr:VOC family protein [Acuticoccus kandeliae]
MSEAREKAAAYGMNGVSPHLVCKDAFKAIEFYKAALGAEEMAVFTMPDGGLMHGCLSINGSSVMIAEENPSCGSASPLTLKGTPVSIHLIVDDVDAALQTAVDAGATLIMPAEDMFWGDRFGVIDDPFGHRWSMATPGKPMSKAEVEEAAVKAFAAAGAAQ